MSTSSVQLAEIALKIEAVRFSPEDPFCWASGYYMPIYNDNRLLLSHSSYRAMVAEGLAGIISEESIALDSVAGTATAGIPHATTLADKLEKPLCYVRSKAKGHGLENMIEGKLEAGQRIVVIEDVVSTGGSSVRAVDAVREAGGQVDFCLAIFSYGFEKANKCFSDANCQLRTLLDFSTLLNVAKEKAYLTADQFSELEAWVADPFGWGEARGFKPRKS